MDERSAANRLWWHVDSEFYVYQNPQGVAVCFINGRQWQIVVGSGWKFASWVRREIIVVGPLYVEDSYEFVPAGIKTSDDDADQ